MAVESSQHWLEGQSLSGDLVATAEKGLLGFTNFAIEWPPGEQAFVLIRTSSRAFKVTVQLRKCIVGEIAEENNCVVCLPETHSVDLQDCSLCHLGSECPGDGNLYPKPSYWRPVETYDGVFACGNKDACKGHVNYTSQTRLCVELYEGNLCQKCVAGASRRGADKCAQCPSPTSNYFLLVGAGLGTAAIVVVLTRSALRSVEH